MKIWRYDQRLHNHDWCKSQKHRIGQQILKYQVREHGKKKRGQALSNQRQLCIAQHVINLSEDFISKGIQARNKDRFQTFLDKFSNNKTMIVFQMKLAELETSLILEIEFRQDKTLLTTHPQTLIHILPLGPPSAHVSGQGTLKMALLLLGKTPTPKCL